MTHPERDPDLLLFAHGALPPLRAALVRLHLARCPDCCRRLEHLQAASQALAGAIRGPRHPRWSPAAADAPFGGAPAWLLALLVMATILVGLWAVRQHQRFPRRPSVPAGSFPCRPDLPNDRCR